MPINPTLLSRIRSKDPQLTQVDLSYQALTFPEIQELVSALSYNPFITQLDLTGNRLVKECVEELHKCEHLRTLILAGNCLTDEALSGFKDNTTLQTLDLNYNDISDAGLEHLARNSSLITLKLNGNKVRTADKLAKHPRLQSLSLMNNEVDAEGVKGFKYNVVLKTLLLDDNLLKDEGALHLADVPALEELSLEHNQLSDKVAEAFAWRSSPSLKTLSLANNLIADVGAAAFKSNKHITTLNLSGNQVDTAGLHELSKNDVITSLDISFNQIDDDSLTTFQDNKTLILLNLSYNQITSRGISFLIKMKQLKTLLLNYNMAGDEGAGMLATSNLIYLDLTGNNVGFEGASAFKYNVSLRTLVLSMNNLNDAGAMHLAENQRIRELVLCYNSIGDAGVIALAKNLSYEVLKLNYNDFTQKGRAALEAHPSLVKTRLSLAAAPRYVTDKMQLIFTFTHNLLCILGLDGKIHFCNPSLVRLLGYAESELLEKNLLELLHPADRLENNPIAKFGQKFPVVNLSLRILCKSGAFRIIRWNSQFKGQYIYSSCTDITEQKKSEREYLRLQSQKEVEKVLREEAEAHSRQQSKFLAHLSHEMRNPMSCALSLTELVADHIKSARAAVQEGNTEKAKQELDILASYNGDLNTCIKYPQRILNDYLDIAKITEKEVVLEEKPLSVNDVTLEAIQIVHGQALAKGLSFTYNPLPTDIHVRGDALRMQQIVINLLSNAIKFTEKGEVKLNLSIIEKTERDTRLEVKIVDSGIGMTSDELARLFKRFAQASPNTSGTYGGTGLGLYLSRQLSSLMGGDIQVESTPGQGTAFICRLTCKNIGLEEKVEPRDLNMPTLLYNFEQQTKPTVLIVEDNELNRRVLCGILKDQFTFETAENGKIALECYDKKKYDIILMDILMPVMTGVEATREIRRKEKAENRPKTPIIALTGNVLERDVTEVKEAGVNEILGKPYTRSELINLMLGLIKQFKEASAKEANLPLTSSAAKTSI